MTTDPATLHRRIFTIDTHLDTPTASLLRPGWNLGEHHDYATDGSQCDLPRMHEGGLDAAVFAVFILQAARTTEGRRGARDCALEIIRRTRAVLDRLAGECGLAVTAADGPRLAAAGRLAIYLSIENAQAVGPDVSSLAEFRELGVRLLGLTHLLNNDVADASTDPAGPEWGGLSPFGRDVVAECNRLGIVVDASHASDSALDDMLECSRAPVILSHSGCKAVFDHPRNIDDERLRHLAAQGGVIQINSLSSYLAADAPNPERGAALRGLITQFQSVPLTMEVMAEADRAFEEFDRRFPKPRATLDDFMNHLVHAVEVAGVEHVGIGADFDGGGGVEGLRDVSAYPAVTRALLDRGLAEADIARIWGGNTLRLLRAAELAAGPDLPSADAAPA